MKIGVFVGIIMCIAVGQAGAVLTANSNTLGFWHCDTTETIGANVFSDSPDDQTGGKTTNNLMRLGIGTAYTAGIPSLVSGQAGYGNALSFDGVDDEATSVNAWQNNLSTMAADFWYKPSDVETGTNVLVEATSTWSITIGNSYLSFQAYHPDASNDILAFSSTLGGIGKQNNTSTWYHVTATSDETGLMSLTVNGTTITKATGKTLLLNAKTINFGNKPGNTRNFAGLIDEVYVGSSLTPEPATLAILGLGALILGRKRK